jgi:hypothetical protein
MVVLPLQKRSSAEVEPAAAQEKELNWAAYAAGVSLVAGGLLLLSRKRRAGMVAASAGTALALLDQQETLRTWWHTLPSYIDEVQRTLSQVQNAVNDMDAKRETLHRILSR